MITAAQIRAARAMLGWSVRALARKADVPEFAVEWIEGAGTISAKDRKAMKAIQSSFEEAGIEFVGTVGCVQAGGDPRMPTATRGKTNFAG